MAPKGKKPPSTAHYTHESAGRPNLPTAETQDMMPDEEQQPQTFAVERRRGEEPTLNWARAGGPGESQYDAYPLYIREKVHPGAFVQSLQTAGSDQLGLFEDFNGLPPEASYEWYRHTGNWQNRLIHGESARVMASLAGREGLAGQVQMIFFDPPYGIGFKSNFQVAVRQRETKENRQGLPADPKMIRAFRDTYERGIDSYLDQMLEKLTLARQLLTESGSIFVQIGDENVHRMAIVLDEVFGHENRVATIPFATSGSASSRTLPSVADFLLWYAKDVAQVKYRQIYEHLSRREKIKHMSSYVMVEKADGTARKLTKEEKLNTDILPDGARLFRRTPLTSQGRSTTGRSEPYFWDGVRYDCPETAQWAVSMEGLDRLSELNRLDSAGPGKALHWRWYEEEVPGRKINNIWHRPMSTSDKVYVVQTANSVIERCLLMSTDPGDLVFDPTCGSGTTAQAAEKWGRRWITCDTSNVAVAVARQRFTTSTHPYWTIDDQSNGSSQLDRGSSDPAAGFIYEKVRHVSARRLADDNPPEYHELFDRPQKTRGVVRVCSPFTVESETPYAYLPVSGLAEDRSDHARAALAQGEFEKRVIDTLLATGISNSAASPTIQINEVEPWPGQEGSLVTHKARYRLGASQEKEAAVMIAAEDVTVTPALLSAAVNESAKQVYGTELLIAAAFAFDPATSDLTKVGRVDISRVQMNRDLQIGELNPDQASEAFVMLGEPDLAINQDEDGQWQVEVRGFDTFNPRTGGVDGGKDSDIACWMIDTDHDERSFFARRIHFPNAQSDRQVKRLRRALGQGLDQLKWEAAFSTKSAPFPTPQTGKIAVKIITETGIEMTVTRPIYP